MIVSPAVTYSKFLPDVFVVVSRMKIVHDNMSYIKIYQSA